MNDALTIIIPTLNEGDMLQATLANVAGVPETHVIVVDGGSHDQTVPIAMKHGATVVHSPPGRGCQMNAGAARAQSGILLFLHADTLLPEQFVSQVRQCLKQKNVAAGAFRFRLDGKQPMFRVVEWLVNLRCMVFKLPFGDQALFVRRQTFDRLNGFASWSTMEDVDFVRRAKKHGRILLLEAPVITSSRRWHINGFIKTTLANQLSLICYFLRLSPARIDTIRHTLLKSKP